MMMITNFIAFATFSALTSSTNCFSTVPSAARTAIITNGNSQLMMASSSESTTTSRRDIFKNAIVTATTAAAVFVISPDIAEAKPKPTVPRPISFQGVFYDPKHPDGYRTIIASSKGGGAIMNLSDGVPKGSDEEEKTYKNLPVKVSSDAKQLTFDFGFKGGPKNIIGTLSDDGRSIIFEDGNIWIKNKNQYDGVYNDLQHPNGYRVLRKKKGSIMEVEINNVGISSPKDSIYIKGKHQSLFSIPTVAISFQFPAPNTLPGSGITEEIIASLYLIDGNSLAPYGTITFPDGNRWTQL